MEPYQERVMREYDEIVARQEKLAAFLESEKSHAIDPQERELLFDQNFAMLMYIRVLQHRIALWERNPKSERP